jgi:hypothetical protein
MLLNEQQSANALPVTSDVTVGAGARISFPLSSYFGFPPGKAVPIRVAIVNRADDAETALP